MLKKRYVPKMLRRQGIPFHEMKLLQMDSVIQLELRDILESLDYRRRVKRPNFLLILGASGKGKTGLVLQLGKVLNERNGHPWDVKKYYHLASDFQLTAAYIKKNYKAGMWVIVDEFHLVAPSFVSSVEQLRDIVRYFNVIRQTGINLIGITQDLRDIHSSVRDKFGFQIQTTHCDLAKQMIYAKVEMRVEEEGGNWQIGWKPYQDIHCGFGDPEEHAFVERIKGGATLTEDSEMVHYRDSKHDRLQGLKEERTDLIVARYNSEEITLEDAIYLLRTINQGFVYIRTRLEIRRKDHGLVNVVDSRRAGDKRRGTTPPDLQKILLDIDEELGMTENESL